MKPSGRRVSKLIAGLVLTLAGACATAGSDVPGDVDGGGHPPDPVDASPFIDAVGPGPVIDAGGPGPVIDAAAPADAPPGGNDCGDPTCEGASNLGAVSGDADNDVLTASGHQAAWYRVRVTEDDHGVFPVSERLAARLTSPASASFDVFVYLDPDNEVVECSETFGNKTSSGNLYEVKAEWGESGLFANGSEDGRDVSIEVRPISGVCAPGQTWQLEVEGNF